MNNLLTMEMRHYPAFWNCNESKFDFETLSIKQSVVILFGVAKIMQRNDGMKAILSVDIALEEYDEYIIGKQITYRSSK